VNFKKYFIKSWVDFTEILKKDEFGIVFKLY